MSCLLSNLAPDHEWDLTDQAEFEARIAGVAEQKHLLKGPYKAEDLEELVAEVFPPTAASSPHSLPIAVRRIVDRVVSLLG